MSKEQFIKIVEALKKQRELDDTTGKAIDTIILASGNDNFPCVYTTPLIDEIIKSFPKEIAEEVSYFAYELDFGTNKLAESCIILGDGSRRSLKTAEELYDYMKENSNYYGL